MFYLRLIIFGLLFSTACKAQNIDSLIDAKVKNQIKKDYEHLNKKNDSLRNELIYFKAKESIYSDALSSQTSLFLWIMGVIVTVATFISYKFITDKFDLVEAAILSLRNSFNLESNNNNARNKTNEFNVLLGISETKLLHGYSESYYDHNPHISDAIKYTWGAINTFAIAHIGMTSSKREHIEKIFIPAINILNSIITQTNCNIFDHKDDIEKNYHDVNLLTIEDWKNVINDTYTEDILMKILNPDDRSLYYSFKFNVDALIKKFENYS